MCVCLDKRLGKSIPDSSVLHFFVYQLLCVNEEVVWRQTTAWIMELVVCPYVNERLERQARRQDPQKHFALFVCFFLIGNIFPLILDWFESWTPCCWCSGRTAAGTPLLCFYHCSRLCHWPRPALKKKTPCAIHPSLARSKIACAIYFLRRGSGRNSVHCAAPVRWALKRSSLSYCWDKKKEKEEE